MKYSLEAHGDALEKKYLEFIKNYFPTYEKVWQVYIGNVGNNAKAEIPGYPEERNNKRQAFSEHTYTILQSLILMYRLIERKVFDQVDFDNVEEKLDLQQNISTFYKNVGGIRDNVIAAAKCLNIDPNPIDKQFDEFYHQRHIPIHGRIMPIIFKSNGEIDMPVLSKNDEDPTGWNHKIHNWPDILSMPVKSINSTTNELFWKYLQLIVDVFGRFEKSIVDELASMGVVLKFEYTVSPDGMSGSSGYDGAIDVYGLYKKDQSRFSSHRWNR